MADLDALTKTELATLRAELVAKVAATEAPALRVEIQAELSCVNAQLKQANIDEARKAKSVADAKKSRGQAEQQANLARARGAVKTIAAAPFRHGSGGQVRIEDAQAILDRAHEVFEIGAQPPQSPRLLTRGEFLIKNAKQMMTTIDKIKEPLPHTVAFRPHLAEFIERQRAHLRAPVPTTLSIQQLQKITTDIVQSVAADYPKTPTAPQDWEKTWAEDPAPYEAEVRSAAAQAELAKLARKPPDVSYIVMTCGRCEGIGRVSRQDGVGGKWQERCDQCHGLGTVEASSKPIPQER